MPRPAKILAAVLTGLLVLALLATGYWQRGRELGATKAGFARLLAEAQQRELLLSSNASRIAELETALAAVERQAGELQRQNEQLIRERDAVTESQKGLEDEMRRALESKDITISELRGKLTVSILDRVLFDSGEATLKPEGEQVLRRVAEVLAQYPERQVHVIGHTDNVPIKPSARGRFPSNWELSTARATAAVRFLSEQAGVDPRRLGAVGYGEFRPAADNATAEGRAQNRRIAIVVLSEEIVGSDTAPGVAPFTPPAATTNSVPAAAAATEPAP